MPFISLNRLSATKHGVAGRNGWQRKAIILAAAVLALGFGFCVLPGHHGDFGNHGHSPELCASLVVVPLTIIPLARPDLNGWSAPTMPPAVPSLLPGLFERPPEFAIPS